MLLKEPISAVPPSLSNVDCVEKKCEGLMWTLQWGGGGGQEGALFLPAVVLVSQEFWPWLPENPLIGKSLLTVKKLREKL